jgi:archaellum component FlaC
MGQINSLVNTLNSTLGSVNETMDKTEKHLNKLVRIAELQLDKTSEVKNSIAQLDYAIVK